MNTFRIAILLSSLHEEIWRLKNAIGRDEPGGVQQIAASPRQQQQRLTGERNTATRAKGRLQNRGSASASASEIASTLAALSLSSSRPAAATPSSLSPSRSLQTSSLARQRRTEDEERLASLELNWGRLKGMGRFYYRPKEYGREMARVIRELNEILRA
jgi:hypothetical protein